MSHLLCVVEKEPALSLLLRTTFEQEGYAVEVLSDISAAIKVLHTIMPALLLLDYQPSAAEDSYRLISHMQSHASLRNVPIIVLSAHREVSRLLAAYAEVILPTPLDVNRLLGLVASYMPPDERQVSGGT